MSKFKFDIGDVVRLKDKKANVKGIIRHMFIPNFCDCVMCQIEVLSGRLPFVAPHDCGGHVPSENGYQFCEDELVLIRKFDECDDSENHNMLQKIFAKVKR